MTGSEVVKGVEVDRGQYVTLSKNEIREALPKTTQTTQTIEIESFVKLEDVPTVFYNKPYYTSPINKGVKVYALLRAKELQMGEQLVMDLADDWHPERFKDEFAEKVAALIEAKRKAGEVKQVVELMGAEVAPASADVIELSELLRRSLQGRVNAEPVAAPAPTAKKKPASTPKAPAKRAGNDDRERAAAAAKSSDKARASVEPARRKAA